MKSIVLGVLIVGIVEFCTALPIGSTASGFGDSNKYLLGGLILISFGAVFGACVCCRRRKKGFEEFQNEAGTLESNRTEYPIFRALSPESQRSILVANARNIGDNDNLIEEDFDNNNGPISPIDLENIENNNAVDYIQNQNEISIAIDESQYSRNRNIAVSHESVVLQDVVVSLTTTDLDLPTENKNDTENMNSFQPNEVKEEIMVEKKLSQLHNVPTYNVSPEQINVNEIEKPLIATEINNHIDSIIVENNDIIEDIEDTRERELIAAREESCSLKSSSSEKSNDINSVEEALRVLDSAIAIGEIANLNCDDDDNDVIVDDDDESLGDDQSDNSERSRTNFHNVIQQLLTNNGANNFLPDLTVNVDAETITIDNDLEYIQNEAKLLVDSILKEGNNFVCDQLTNLSKIQNFNETDMLPNSSIETNTTDNVENLNQKTYTNNATINITNLDNDLTLLSPLEDIIENDFKDLTMKTSTPCIQSKFINRIEKNEHSKFVQKLFDDSLDNGLNSTKTINKDPNKTYTETFIINITENSPNSENNGTFILPKEDNNTEDGVMDNNENGFVYPGDPCTSRQALERDCGYLSVHYDRDEINSEDLTTVTPVNTPIELNYPQDTWNKITKKSVIDNEDETSPYDGCESSGWFLHPQTNVEINETFDVEDENNLESTFEALRKQLAEVLPQAQGMAGPPDFSDEEDEPPNNRASPLDGLIGLLESEPTTSQIAQNELFINYKRPLSPIIEESEEETCRTFVMNETKCLDSTSTGCVDTGEAIMGVTKTLMASNDTLFNFEDTLGEREDVFSPRTPSRSETNPHTPVKSGISTEENSIETNDSSSRKSENLPHSVSEGQEKMIEKRSPPKSINIIEEIDMKQDGELCSPEQQKTFSEGTSSTGEHGSSDLSATIDHDTTFTTNTIDEKTCITVILKDDERISEISEPEWGSTASYGCYEMNSLTDAPSLDFINDFEEKLKEDEQNQTQELQFNETIILNDKLSYENDIAIENNDDNCQDHSEEEYKNEELSSENTSDKDNSVVEEKTTTIGNEDIPSNSEATLEAKQNCLSILREDVDIILNDNDEKNKINQNTSNSTIDTDGSKENTDPNIKILLKSISNDYDINTSYQKVQTNSQDAVINDKIRNISSHILEGDLSNGLHENVIHQQELAILPVKHQQTITNYSVNDVSGIQNEHNCLIVTDEMIGTLSGEEDPWVEPLTDIRFIGPCSEVISTSFTVNEWDSDVDDSHSSEEFMYVRGPAPTMIDEKSKNLINSRSEILENNKNFRTSSETEYESHVWSSHEDKIPVGNTIEDETSEESSSEFEGEFVPSCWDSMAIPARSALKSPDKSSSEEEPKSENKKRRSVAFKKQRYHSVYEYPRENTSLSPAYSEPFLWNKNMGNISVSDNNEVAAEFNDGFAVSSTMRPFHGSQFNALCHTWPTDSDFSWSQVEDLNDFIDDKKLATYSNIDVKWPSRESSTDESSELKTHKTDESLRPDSGVGESADTISERLLLGELCHTKSTLRLPLEIISPIETLPESKPENNKEPEYFSELSILPTPSCTGSMDSLSSSSGSERQISFSTFGKRNNLFNENDKKNINDNMDTIIRPSIILIENDSIENSHVTDKIKQGDSTDEDSGIESIMKINKDND